MNSSPRSDAELRAAESSSRSQPPSQPLPSMSARDPYEVLEDLMQVVEALCPVWPEKDLPASSFVFRL